MINELARMFGYVPKKDLDELRDEVQSLKKDIIKMSNILGMLARKVETATTTGKQNGAAIQAISSVQADLAMEFVSLFDGLQTVSSKKNIGIGFSSFGRDDDDDLLN